MKIKVLQLYSGTKCKMLLTKIQYFCQFSENPSFLRVSFFVLFLIVHQNVPLCYGQNPDLCKDFDDFHVCGFHGGAQHCGGGSLRDARGVILEQALSFFDLLSPRSG